MDVGNGIGVAMTDGDVGGKTALGVPMPNIGMGVGATAGKGGVSGSVDILADPGGLVFGGKGNGNGRTPGRGMSLNEMMDGDLMDMDSILLRRGGNGGKGALPPSFFNMLMPPTNPTDPLVGSPQQVEPMGLGMPPPMSNRAFGLPDEATGYRMPGVSPADQRRMETQQLQEMMSELRRDIGARPGDEKMPNFETGMDMDMGTLAKPLGMTTEPSKLRKSESTAATRGAPGSGRAGSPDPLHATAMAAWNSSAGAADGSGGAGGDTPSFDLSSFDNVLKGGMFGTAGIGSGAEADESNPTVQMGNLTQALQMQRDAALKSHGDMQSIIDQLQRDPSNAGGFLSAMNPRGDVDLGMGAGVSASESDLFTGDSVPPMPRLPPGKSWQDVPGMPLDIGSFGLEHAPGARRTGMAGVQGMDGGTGHGMGGGVYATPAIGPTAGPTHDDASRHSGKDQSAHVKTAME